MNGVVERPERTSPLLPQANPQGAHPFVRVGPLAHNRPEAGHRALPEDASLCLGDLQAALPPPVHVEEHFAEGPSLVRAEELVARHERVHQQAEAVPVALHRHDRGVGALPSARADGRRSMEAAPQLQAYTLGDGDGVAVDGDDDDVAGREASGSG